MTVISKFAMHNRNHSSSFEIGLGRSELLDRIELKCLASWSKNFSNVVKVRRFSFIFTLIF